MSPRLGSSVLLSMGALAAFLAIAGATVMRRKVWSLVRDGCVTITFIPFRRSTPAEAIKAGGAIRVSGGCASRRAMALRDA